MPHRLGRKTDPLRRFVTDAADAGATNQAPAAEPTPPAEDPVHHPRTAATTIDERPVRTDAVRREEPSTAG